MNIDYDSEEGVVTPWYIRRVEARFSVDDLDSVAVSILLKPGGNPTVLKQLMPGEKYKLKLDNLQMQGDFVHMSFRQTALGLEATAHGLETLHRLRHQRLSEIKEQTRDEVVKTLLKMASVKSSSVGAAKPVKDFQVSLDDDGVKLLKKLCAERNFALYYSAGKLTYAARNVAKRGVAVKVSSASLTDLQLSLDLSEVVTSVTMHGRDYRKASTVMKFTAVASKLKTISKGSSAAKLLKDGFGPREHEIPWSLGKATPSALEESAVATLQARAETFARGRCSGEWNTALSPLSLVQFEDVSWPLTGPFLVSSVTHVVEDGMTETTAEFFSDSLSKG